MKTFCLLWLNGASGNDEVATTRATDGEMAAHHFGMEGKTFKRQENGGAWCVAEVFECLS